jgi:hypothetical protein
MFMFEDRDLEPANVINCSPDGDAIAEAFPCPACPGWRKKTVWHWGVAMAALQALCHSIRLDAKAFEQSM